GCRTDRPYRRRQGVRARPRRGYARTHRRDGGRRALIRRGVGLVDFRTYFNGLLERPQDEGSILGLVRNFSNWFFDLLRNFVLVGGLRYFAEKSDSMLLW